MLFRSLFWDTGHGYELSSANRSGILVIATAVILTAATWALGLTHALAN